MAEIHDRYQDSDLAHLYATYLLDGRHESPRFVARIISRLNNAIMNALRICGHNAGDHLYVQEDALMPMFEGKTLRQQPWDEMRQQIGFK